MTPPNTAGAQALSDEQIKAAISEAIGFDWKQGELQPVNAHDLFNIASAVLALSSREQAGAVAEPSAAPGDGQAQAATIRIDFKQATELLDMFGGEPTGITLSHYPRDEHHFEEGFTVSAGLYAHYTEYPEEGSNYLGETDIEAAPGSAIDAREQGGQCQYAADVGMAEYRCVGKCQYAHTTPRAVESSESVHVAQFAHLLQAECGAAIAAREQEDYRDGVNVDALAHALTLMGIAGCGREEMAARMSQYVNYLTRGVESYFEKWNATLQQEHKAQAAVNAIAALAPLRMLPGDRVRCQCCGYEWGGDLSTEGHAMHCAYVIATSVPHTPPAPEQSAKGLTMGGEVGHG